MALEDSSSESADSDMPSFEDSSDEELQESRQALLRGLLQALLRGSATTLRGGGPPEKRQYPLSRYFAGDTSAAPVETDWSAKRAKRSAGRPASSGAVSAESPGPASSSAPETPSSLAASTPHAAALRRGGSTESVASSSSLAPLALFQDSSSPHATPVTAHAQGKQVELRSELVRLWRGLEAPDGEARLEDVETRVVAIRQELHKLHGALGGEAGVLGGRPQSLVPRGTNGGDTSNRALPGGERKRRDYKAWEALKMIAWMEDKMKSGLDPTQFWRQACMRYDAPRKTLQKVLEKKSFYQGEVQKRSLGAGGALRVRGSKVFLSRTKGQCTGEGCRAAGAGRKDYFKHIKAAIKVWAEEERAYGHRLSRTDFTDEFIERATQEAEALQVKIKAAEASDAEVTWKRMLEERLQRLKHQSKYLHTFGDRLIQACSFRLLRPQRLTQLGFAEERALAKMTWQMLDRAIWLAACSPGETLENFVANPSEFARGRQTLVLGFSDQVPWWVGFENQKQLYHAAETASRKEKGHDFRELQQRGALSQAHWSEAQDGMTQNRGCQVSGSEKLRITLELRQLIFDYFSGDSREPRGEIGPTAIIVSGAHGRLSNISPEGTFIEDEVFYFQDKRIERQAGKSARGLMKSWRVLREAEPHLFENVVVYQQPAAFLDNVIHKWMLEDLASRYPRTVWQRDALAAHMAPEAVEAMFVSWQVPSYIGGHMTPVLQITDTDFAAPFKASARRAKDDLRSLLKKRAREEGVKEAFVTGNREMLLILQRSLKEMREKNAAEKTVLKAARRNGLLAYRPQAKPGEDMMKLVKCDEQPWSADFPEGNHRMKGEWLASRYDWLDQDGIPLEPDFSEVKAAKNMVDLAEASYCRMLKDETDPLEMVLEGALEDADAAIEKQKHPAERRLQTRVDQLVSQKTSKQENTRVEKRLQKMTTSALRSKLKRSVAGDLEEGVTRRQLLQRLVPVASKGKSKKGSQGKPSLKNKPSAKRKAAKKNAQKNSKKTLDETKAHGKGKTLIWKHGIFVKHLFCQCKYIENLNFY